MTKTLIPEAVSLAPAPEAVPSMHAPPMANPPSYNAATADQSTYNTPEKPHVCPKHGASQTPNIDKHLRQFKVNDRLQSLAPLNNALDGESCTKCALETVTGVLSGYIRDVKAAKKNGDLTRAEKRALKAESRALFRGMKKDMRSAWRDGCC